MPVSRLYPLSFGRRALSVALFTTPSYVLASRVRRCRADSSHLYKLTHQMCEVLTLRHLQFVQSLCTCRGQEALRTFSQLKAARPKDTVIEVYGEVSTYWLPRWRGDYSIVIATGSTVFRV